MRRSILSAGLIAFLIFGLVGTEALQAQATARHVIDEDVSSEEREEPTVNRFSLRRSRARAKNAILNLSDCASGIALMADAERTASLTHFLPRPKLGATQLYRYLRVIRI
jgi:hypothetical protein